MNSSEQTHNADHIVIRKDAHDNSETNTESGAFIGAGGWFESLSPDKNKDAGVKRYFDAKLWVMGSSPVLCADIVTQR